MTIHLHTKRLRLRPFENNDITHFIPIATQPDIAVLPMPNKQQAIDAVTEVIAKSWIEHARHAITAGTAYQFAIISKTSTEFVGMSGLTSVDKKRLVGQFGFWIGRDYRKRGYASEAGREVVNFAFSRLRLTRLIAVTAHGNIASEKVLKQIGFSRTVGLRRKLNPATIDGNITRWELVPV